MSISRSEVPTEHAEQTQFFLLASYILTADQYSLLWATPNGGLREKRNAAALVAEGVKKGVPDVVFAYPTEAYSGLFIEFKRRKGSKVSDEQKEMISRLRNSGYKAEICYGCDEGIATLKAYLGIK